MGLKIKNRDQGLWAKVVQGTCLGALALLMVVNAPAEDAAVPLLTNSAPEFARAFLAQCAALAQAAEVQGAMTVPGRDGPTSPKTGKDAWTELSGKDRLRRPDWLFLASELRHLGVGPFWGESAAKVSRAIKPDQADPLPAIADFHDQLTAMGIELLVVPVPPVSHRSAKTHKPK